jgi:hypothetical protein
MTASLFLCSAPAPMDKYPNASLILSESIDFTVRDKKLSRDFVLKLKIINGGEGETLLQTNNHILLMHSLDAKSFRFLQ